MNQLIIRPWKKGKAKYEAIKWQTGFRNLWDRISYEEFLKVKSSDSTAVEDFFKSLEGPLPIPPSFDQVIAKLEDWKTTNPQTLALVLKFMGFKQETAL